METLVINVIPNADFDNTMATCQKEVTCSEGDIRVYENATFRWLCYGSAVVHSAMLKRKPQQLLLPYQQYMMIWQLFASQLKPKSCLLLGLGGGDIVRYLQHNFSSVNLLTVEKQSAINKIACDYFHLQPKEPALQCHTNDAGKFLQTHKQQHDLIFVDMLENDHLPIFMLTEQFWRQCKEVLSPTGLLVVNIIVKDSQTLRTLLLMLKDIFNYLPLCMNVPDHRNIILLLSAKRLDKVSLETLAEQAINAENKYLLSFPQFVQQLAKDNYVDNGYFKLD